jgi:hypothetical protein
MEGRVPPAGGDETDDNPLVGLPRPPPPPPLAFHSETYVIQVPKDQIYRIPPPENALIAERLRKPGKRNKKKSRRCSFCLLLTGVILVVLALIGIAIATLYFVFNPKGPSFSVVQALVKNPKSSSTHKHSQPGYEISLRVKNPNEFMGIYYRSGGVATLSFKGKKIAKGKFPRSYQDMKKSTKIKVVLKGSNTTLPRQIDKSVKDKKSKLPIFLALNVKFQVKMKLGTIKTWIIDTDVACKFKVRKLGMGTKILWQKCQTEFES